MTDFTYFTLPENESRCLECIFGTLPFVFVATCGTNLIDFTFFTPPENGAARRDLLEDCPLDKLSTRCNTLQHAATH